MPLSFLKVLLRGPDSSRRETNGLKHPAKQIFVSLIDD